MPRKPQWYNLEHYPKTNAPVSKWISSGQQAQEHARILGMSDHPKREKEQILRSSSDGTQGCCLGSYLSTPVGCLSGLCVLWRRGRILSLSPSILLFLSYLSSFLPPFISGKITGQKTVERKCFMSAEVAHHTQEAWKPPGCIKTSQQWPGISTVDCIPVSLLLRSFFRRGSHE